ncbi:MAG TPA: tetratricopeptide repeat protein [Conexibacter sp.]|nr:tetratricopeptide repeat protein [Conexibacter sp.]
MIFDVTEQDFEAQVLDRSRTLPVVVDFWAEWCGPCRQLGPVLEAAVTARAGKIALAKLDTDANPSISRAFGIQGIPAVKAFRDGRDVAEFVGAQPRANVERFLDALLPSEADALVAAGDEASLRKAVEAEPNRADALVPLARLLHARGEDDEALELLERAPGDFGGAGLAARIRLQRAGAPDLGDAFAALDAGEHERALDLLIGALPSADGAKDEIRKVVVGVLDELGVEHPLARDARRRLAAALY